MPEGHLRRLIAQVWDRLGLRLQYCGSGSPGEMIFSVQHPDLSSALIAPQGTLSADFRSSSWRIDISTKRAPRASRDGRRKRQRMEQGLARAETPSTVPPSDGDDFYHCLTSADRRAVEDFVLSMDFGANPPQERQGAGHEEVNSARLVESLTGSDTVRDFVQLAIRMLVCGQKGQQKGFTILQSSPLHSLTNLAPAVFHIPYLKARVQRRKLLGLSLTPTTGRVRSRKAPPDTSHFFGSNDNCRVTKPKTGCRIVWEFNASIGVWQRVASLPNTWGSGCRWDREKGVGSPALGH